MVGDVRWSLASILVATTVWAAPAAAQTSSRERAQQHFDAGRKHVREGHCDLAIEEFKSSIDFEPTSIGAYLNLGDCYAIEQRPVDAYRAFKTAEQLAVQQNNPRVTLARAAVAQLDAKLVHVLLREEDDATTPNLVVTVDGVVTPRPWTIVVAPNGAHTITATAGERRWKEQVQANAGDVVRLTIKLSAPPKPAGTTTPPAPSEGPPNETSAPPYKTIGLVIGGVGIVGLAVGGVFGVLALSRREDLKDLVDGDARCRGGYPAASCDPSARSAIVPTQDSATAAATVSTVAFIAGGVLLVGGAVLVFTAPSARTTAKLVVADGVGVSGTF